jgi:formylmethanofuran dehydrogenase subunit D
MKTNDVVMVGLGFIAGYFLKSIWNKRNTVVQTSTDDTNYVFSPKYKNCEAEVNKRMELSEFSSDVDLDAYKKNYIDACMKKA